MSTWQKILLVIKQNKKQLICLVLDHNWQFHHELIPPVVKCQRCDRTDPMPYGDARQPYL